MGNDGLNVRIAPRRAGGNTRRFPPAHRRACLCKGELSAAGFAAAATFERPISRVILGDSPLKNEPPGVLKGLNSGASRGKACFDTRQLVY